MYILDSKTKKSVPESLRPVYKIVVQISPDSSVFVRRFYSVCDWTILLNSFSISTVQTSKERDGLLDRHGRVGRSVLVAPRTVVSTSVPPPLLLYKGRPLFVHTRYVLGPLRVFRLIYFPSVPKFLSTTPYHSNQI